MASALSILQGFNNSYLQSLTDDQRNSALSKAWLEVDREAFGGTANAAAANLAAHDLIVENLAGSSSSGSSGQFLQLSERKVGPRTEKFTTMDFSNSGSGRSDSDLSRTVYGQRFMRYRDGSVVGISIF